MLKLLVLLMTLNVSLFALHSFELNINEKDLEAELQFDMGQFNETLDPDTTFMGINYLAMTKENSSLNTDPRGLVRANFLVQRALRGFEDLILGMGAKAVYTSLKSGDIEHSFFAVPFGIQAKYHIPFNIPVDFFIAGEIYYSPEVLSFGEAKNYVESKGYLEIQLIETGSILGGYRNIETNYELIGGDVRINESWFAGFKFLF